MKTSFELKASFSVKPSIIYDAWLSSKQHSDMTGGEAHCSNQVEGEFSAWDGYISGRNHSLKQNEEIIQSWRTTEFATNDEDSLVKITLKETEKGCELTLTHSNIPEGDADYEQGWKDHYFAPMKEYF